MLLANGAWFPLRQLVSTARALKQNLDKKEFKLNKQNVKGASF